MCLVNIGWLQETLRKPYVRFEDLLFFCRKTTKLIHTFRCSWNFQVGPVDKVTHTQVDFDRLNRLPAYRQLEANCMPTKYWKQQTFRWGFPCFLSLKRNYTLRHCKRSDVTKNKTGDENRNSTQVPKRSLQIELFAMLRRQSHSGRALWSRIARQQPLRSKTSTASNLYQLITFNF